MLDRLAGTPLRGVRGALTTEAASSRYFLAFPPPQQPAPLACLLWSCAAWLAGLASSAAAGRSSFLVSAPPQQPAFFFSAFATVVSVAFDMIVLLQLSLTSRNSLQISNRAGVACYRQASARSRDRRDPSRRAAPDRSSWRLSPRSYWHGRGPPTRREPCWGDLGRGGGICRAHHAHGRRDRTNARRRSRCPRQSKPSCSEAIPWRISPCARASRRTGRAVHSAAIIRSGSRVSCIRRSASRCAM